MAGRVKKLIDEFVQLRTGGQSGLEHFVKAHLALSGINAQRYTDNSPDDPAVEKKLRTMIEQFGRQQGRGK